LKLTPGEAPSPKEAGLRLGLDTYSYRCAVGLWDYTLRANAPMSLDHLLQKTAELGLDGLQLSDARHLDSLDYGYVSELRGKAEALGLYVELGTSGTNPDHLQNMVRAAHVLGSPVVRTFVGKPRPTAVSGLEKTLAAAADELSQVTPVCERYGVTLAIENHQDLTTRELLQLLARVDSPWVGVCFDTGNPLALLEDPLECARAVGPLVRTVHLKDYQVVARPDGFALVCCPLGEGVVDLSSIMDLLQVQAPAAILNLVVYLGKHAAPALEEEYLRRLPEAAAWELGRTLRLVRDRGLTREPLLVTEREAPEEEVLAAEEELVVRSVRWAKAALGRPGSEADSTNG
jgi:sugar phosphate isomerase/epimerase